MISRCESRSSKGDWPSTLRKVVCAMSEVAFQKLSTRSPSLVFGFHFQRQSRDADDFDGLAGLDGRFAHGVPLFAFDKHPAAAPVNARKRVDRLAQHRFLAGLNRSQLRAQSRAD